MELRPIEERPGSIEGEIFEKPFLVDNHTVRGLETLRVDNLNVAANNRTQAFMKRGREIPHGYFICSGDDNALHWDTSVLVSWISSRHR